MLCLVLNQFADIILFNSELNFICKDGSETVRFEIGNGKAILDLGIAKFDLDKSVDFSLTTWP